MGWESSGVVGFDLGPLIINPRGIVFRVDTICIGSPMR